MPARTPSTPPVILGMTAQQLLGSGSYSDVFLYDQERPRRPVAWTARIAAATRTKPRSKCGCAALC
jgi:hypothetical protein